MIERLSLSDEITFNQFGQGVVSELALLERFSQFNEEQKRMRVLSLFTLARQSKLNEEDIKQVLTDVPPTKPDQSPFSILYTSRLNKGLRINLAETELDNSFVLLLRLFKTAYQRCYEREKGNIANWWYWDLSKPETVQRIVSRHNELVEEVYNDPGFKSEFSCIAKLWNKRKENRGIPQQDPTPDSPTRFNFLSYDEIVYSSMIACWDKTLHSIMALENALKNALSKRYGLPIELIERVTNNVIERYYREMYNSGLIE